MKVLIMECNLFSRDRKGCFEEMMFELRFVGRLGSNWENCGINLGRRKCVKFLWFEGVWKVGEVERR